MTSWTVAHQAPLSMGFFRQGSWSGLPFPPPFSFFNRNFPTPFSIFNAESNTLHVTDSQQILSVNSHVYAAVSIVCVSGELPGGCVQTYPADEDACILGRLHDPVHARVCRQGRP